MRSTLRRTHSARSVMSPRLPIGVATRCRPGASACAGCQSAASGSARIGRRAGRRRRSDRGGDCRSDCFRPGLLAGVRWLGSPPPLASRPEAILAALASSAFRLNPCCFRAAARPCRVRRPDAYRHRRRPPQSPIAAAKSPPTVPAADPAGSAAAAGSRADQGWRPAAAVRSQRRTRQGNARSGAARAVRDTRRKADAGAARHRRSGRRRRRRRARRSATARS